MNSIKNSKDPKKASLICIVGPTASGKTSLSMKLAKILKGEVISADSLQIYKEFDIGSAKPEKELLSAVTHHLIGVVSPEYTVNAFNYAKLAKKAIYEVIQKGKFPLLVGGSGLYIRAVLDGLVNVEGSCAKTRQNIIEEVKERGLGALYEELLISDPEAAKKIHVNDEMRIVRALELFRVTKKTKKEMAGTSTPLSIGNLIIVGLTMKRADIYDRINKRVDLMLQKGIVEEVKYITDKYGFDIAPLKGLGYKQFTEYLKGNISLEKAIYLTKMNTRHYAKRQITWFKKDSRVKWLDAKEDESVLLNNIISTIKEYQCKEK
ncbi:MAG: tRNA (adenosine(37)-N6)-dimethylallyltransferase MiaA [Candidatus Firestonebacteria bacterium]|nr:tRNA (adenosine(37)-N6)-dimethylallyltransferase MiaA [Candidatus Firestonebacteria bacterium]